MQHIHDRQTGVQTDEISQFQRPHRVVGPQFHRTVNRHHVADTFIQRIDGLIDHRHQQSVDDKSRKIFCAGRGFAQIFNYLLTGPKGWLVCGDAPDQFDQLHHRHRVHKVKPHEFLGSVGAAGQTGD